AADRFIIALAHHEVVPDDAAKRSERQDNRLARAVHRRMNMNAQSVLFDCQVQMKRPAASRSRRKMILLQQIKYRHGTLVFDAGIESDNGMLVEGDACDHMTNGIAWSLYLGQVLFVGRLSGCLRYI